MPKHAFILEVVISSLVWQEKRGNSGGLGHLCCVLLRTQLEKDGPANNRSEARLIVRRDRREWARRIRPAGRSVAPFFCFC
jgi:hypothetical protein